MRENGSLISIMVKGQKQLLMGRYTRVTLSKGNETGMDFYKWLMGLPIVVIGKRTCFMEKGSINGLTAESIPELLKTTECTAKAPWNLVMVENTKESSDLTIEKVLEPIFGQTVQNTLETGNKTNRMAMAKLHSQMVRLGKVNGSKGKGFDGKESKDHLALKMKNSLLKAFN